MTDSRSIQLTIKRVVRKAKKRRLEKIKSGPTELSLDTIDSRLVLSLNCLALAWLGLYWIITVERMFLNPPEFINDSLGVLINRICIVCRFWTAWAICIWMRNLMLPIFLWYPAFGFWPHYYLLNKMLAFQHLFCGSILFVTSCQINSFFGQSLVGGWYPCLSVHLHSQWLL